MEFLSFGGRFVDGGRQLRKLLKVYTFISVLNVYCLCIFPTTIFPSSIFLCFYFLHSESQVHKYLTFVILPLFSTTVDFKSDGPHVVEVQTFSFDSRGLTKTCNELF